MFLFIDALNTFYLRLYGVGHMVKDHSDSERGNPLPPHGLLFPISSKGSFICTIPQTGQHIPQPLLHQSWITGHEQRYNNKYLYLHTYLCQLFMLHFKMPFNGIKSMFNYTTGYGTNLKGRLNRSSRVYPFWLSDLRKEMFYLTTHTTHFIYGYMVSDIW